MSIEKIERRCSREEDERGKVEKSRVKYTNKKGKRKTWRPTPSICTSPGLPKSSTTWPRPGGKFAINKTPAENSGPWKVKIRMSNPRIAFSPFPRISGCFGPGDRV
jgi:hypothetical protein